MKNVKAILMLMTAGAMVSACGGVAHKTYSSNMPNNGLEVTKTSQSTDVADVTVDAENNAGNAQDIKNNTNERAENETDLSAGDIALGSLSDPMEGVNRKIFGFNKVVDESVIFPVLRGYRAAVPQPARTGLSNFLRNLKTPTRFANQILQGDATGAMNELTRGVVNTVVGIGGIIDVAGAEGLKNEDEDFGQTLGVWGVGHGPYIVVPFFGGGSARDLAGFMVDIYADPLRMYLNNTDKEGLMYARSGAGYLDMRNSLMDVLESLEYSAVDYYASVRSSYYQSREALERDGKVDESVDMNATEGFDAL